MANIECCKKFKIKPENQVETEATVTKCKYAGSSSVGIGPLAKTTHIYKVWLAVDGIEKPLVLKTKEKQGWNLDIVDSAKSIGKMFSKQMPANEGEKLIIVYDKTKPKKCMIKE